MVQLFGMPVVIKKPINDFLTAKIRESINSLTKEVQKVHTLSNHPGIQQIYGACVDPKAGECAFAAAGAGAHFFLLISII